MDTVIGYTILVTVTSKILTVTGYLGTRCSPSCNMCETML